MSQDGNVLPVAVVIAAYNRQGWVAEAVSSALGQQPTPPAEVIVVDDASTDGTAEAAEQAGARVIRHETNQGAAAARNTGARATDQPWIAPLDSDDRWLPDMLAALWPLRGDFGFVAGASMGVDPSGAPVSYGGPLSDETVILASPAPLVFPENFIAASGVIVRRETFDEVGGYRPSQRQAEDFDLWLRMLAVRPGLSVSRVVTVYRLHDAQKSRGGQRSRDAITDIVLRHRDEPWFSGRLFESHQTMMGWDAMRESLGARDYWPAARRAVWLASSPVRRRALLGTLNRRRARRKRIAGYAAL